MTEQTPLRVFDAVLAQSWAMEEAYLRAMLEVAARDHGPALEALAARQDRPLDNTHRVTIRDGVAVVPVVGPIFRYANLFTALSGATSLQTLAADFNAALADRQVRAILLNVDSPGGEVNGIAEMAAMIEGARGTKPIVAYVGGSAASGGYWLAAAADEIHVAPTATLGSIGVVYGTRDTRVAEEKAGVRTIEIVSSQSPNKRVDVTTSEGRATVLATIDRLAEEFIGAVARTRGVAVETVLSDFGRGGVLVGADAVAAGMADSVSSFEAVLASLASAGSSAGGPGRVFTPRAAAAASSENMTMDIKTIADLKAAFPDLVAQLEKDTATTARAAGEAAGREAGLTEGRTAGTVDGAAAERARILGIQAHGVPGAEKLVAEMVADGATTPDQAGARILGELKNQGPRALAALKADEAKAVGAGAKESGSEAAALTPQAAADAINQEMKAASDAGQVISYAQAAARVRSRVAA